VQVLQYFGVAVEFNQQSSICFGKAAKDEAGRF